MDTCTFFDVELVSIGLSHTALCFENRENYWLIVCTCWKSELDGEHQQLELATNTGKIDASR
jgi:hypothetical protein